MATLDFKERNATVARKTKETDVAVRLSLDGEGRYYNQTGVGFIDHMLDLPAAELNGVCILRTPCNFEERMGRFLERDPHTVVIEKGLGANDAPGNTHLLRLAAGDAWWATLPDRLNAQFDI